MKRNVVLYIGGFELPDKNAAAQRVIGIAKGLRTIGYKVVFINAVKCCDTQGITKRSYFGFRCYEYRRESNFNYLISGRKILSIIKKVRPDKIVAYNYPAVSLNRIRKYCERHDIDCYADVTEWYKAAEGNILYRSIKNFDTLFRMKYVQKKLDGLIVISRFLYNYYRDSVRTVMIPPTVDIGDKKWSRTISKRNSCISVVYAGSPSLQKERLDYIVRSIEQIEEECLIHLTVMGITEEEFRKMYSWNQILSDRILFLGRIDHQQVLEVVKTADWSVIMRENNSVVKAGFPTKLVESISCGTPVIANHFSNIDEYLNDQNSILISHFGDLQCAFERAVSKKPVVDTSIFDYHKYLRELGQIMSPA